jgi:hypothetical protein
VPGHPRHANAVVGDGPDDPGHMGAMPVLILRNEVIAHVIPPVHQAISQIRMIEIRAGVNHRHGEVRVPGRRIPGGRRGHALQIPLLWVLWIVWHAGRLREVVRLREDYTWIGIQTCDDGQFSADWDAQAIHAQRLDRLDEFGPLIGQQALHLGTGEVGPPLHQYLARHKLANGCQGFWRRPGMPSTRPSQQHQQKPSPQEPTHHPPYTD